MRLCFTALYLLCALWVPLYGVNLEIKSAHPALAERVREIFMTNRARLEKLSGRQLEHIIVEIPPERGALERRLNQIGVPLWAAGAALPQRSLIIMRAPHLLHGQQNFQRTFVHELAHLYLYQALNGGRAPWWLREGLAMLAAEENSFSHSTAFAQAVFGENLLPWSLLDGDFFPRNNQVRLAYAQAYYMTSFFEDEALLAGIMRGLSQGYDLNQSLYNISGFSLSQWEAIFNEKMADRFSWLAISAGGSFWGLLGLAAAVIVVWRRRKMLRQIEHMPAPLSNIRVRPLKRPHMRPKNARWPSQRARRARLARPNPGGTGAVRAGAVEIKELK